MASPIYDPWGVRVRIRFGSGIDKVTTQVLFLHDALRHQERAVIVMVALSVFLLGLTPVPMPILTKLDLQSKDWAAALGAVVSATTAALVAIPAREILRRLERKNSLLCLFGIYHNAAIQAVPVEPKRAEQWFDKAFEDLSGIVGST
jgi:hypothetical protein